MAVEGCGRPRQASPTTFLGGPDEEAEELPYLIDDASRELFGITANDTLYPALPESVRASYGRAEWEANFNLLGRYARDANAYWSGFGLDC